MVPSLDGLLSPPPLALADTFWLVLLGVPALRVATNPNCANEPCEILTPALKYFVTVGHSLIINAIIL